MNSTERAFYGSPFWAQKGTFFKCSDKNESFYLQKVCFSDREKFSEPYRLHPKIGKIQHNALYESRCGVGTKFYGWILKM
ncbi:hypothetical protein BRAT_07690 [Leptospira interrogans serovar Bratislava]|nr:hypothetical protein BRAT_07690 [Leptospira interrogans serovar Bratislava]